MIVDEKGELLSENTLQERLADLCLLFSIALTDPAAYLDPNDFDIDSFYE